MQPSLIMLGTSDPAGCGAVFDLRRDCIHSGLPLDHDFHALPVAHGVAASSPHSRCLTGFMAFPGTSVTSLLDGGPDLPLGSNSHRRGSLHSRRLGVARRLCRSMAASADREDGVTYAPIAVATIGAFCHLTRRPFMSDVTRILSQIESGDPAAAEQLLPLVYEELRKLAAAKMAHERPDQTLQATALVHEAYFRLVDGESTQQWKSRGHFFGAAAEAMRRILIEEARRKRRLKRGGQLQRIPLEAVQLAHETQPDDLLALDEAMESLANDFPDCAQLVKLRFFAGLSLGDAAAALGIPRRTADRQWAFARAWLYDQLRECGGPSTD